jgi:hypothetical protein
MNVNDYVPVKPTVTRGVAIYPSHELARLARWACKGQGRMVRWALSCGDRDPVVRVVYRRRDGSEGCTSCAI